VSPAKPEGAVDERSARAKLAALQRLLGSRRVTRLRSWSASTPMTSVTTGPVSRPSESAAAAGHWWRWAV
jgi:hypothetical protein